MKFAYPDPPYLAESVFYVGFIQDAAATEPGERRFEFFRKLVEHSRKLTG